MNIIKPFLERILPLLEERFPTRFRSRPPRPRRMEIQMEFPWAAKK